MTQHIVKIADLYRPTLYLRTIERRVTYQVWWAGGIILLTSNESQARRRAKEVNGTVRMVAENRRI